MKKIQSRVCSSCKNRDERTLEDYECVFIDSEFYFMKWNSPCSSCKSTSFSSISECFDTYISEEMVLSEEAISIWLSDDTKFLRLSEEHTEFMHYPIEKLLTWIDGEVITSYKKGVLIHSLCERLAQEFHDEETKVDISLLQSELIKRKEMIIAIHEDIDSFTKEDVFFELGLTEYI